MQIRWHGYAIHVKKNWIASATFYACIVCGFFRLFSLNSLKFNFITVMQCWHEFRAYFSSTKIAPLCQTGDKKSLCDSCLILSRHIGELYQIFAGNVCDICTTFGRHMLSYRCYKDVWDLSLKYAKCDVNVCLKQLAICRSSVWHLLYHFV
jgi:hypothetical protein